MECITIIGQKLELWQYHPYKWNSNSSFQNFLTKLLIFRFKTRIEAWAGKGKNIFRSSQKSLFVLKIIVID